MHKRIRRVAFVSVPELIAAVEDLFDADNENPRISSGLIAQRKMHTQ